MTEPLSAADRCCEDVRVPGMNFYRSRKCANRAKVVVGGLAYCGVHDPERKREREQARAAAWDRKWAEKWAAPEKIQEQAGLITELQAQVAALQTVRDAYLEEVERLAEENRALRAALERYKVGDRLNAIAERHNNSNDFSHFNNGYDCEACARAYEEAGLLQAAIERDYIDPEALARRTAEAAQDASVIAQEAAGAAEGA